MAKAKKGKQKPLRWKKSEERKPMLKRVKVKTGAPDIIFSASSRKEYVGGFEKRKKERRKAGAEKAAKREKDSRRKEERAVKEGLKEDSARLMKAHELAKQTEKPLLPLTPQEPYSAFAPAVNATRRTVAVSSDFYGSSAGVVVTTQYGFDSL